MRLTSSKTIGLAAAVALAASFATTAQAQKTYKFASLAMGTPFAINTTFAKIVQKYNPDIKIQLNATGIAPRHALDTANGKTDLFMAAPILHFFMSKNLAMFKKVKNAPQLANKLRALFNYRIGFYQFITYADSGIKEMKDIKGKRVFLGPPAAAQRVVAGGFAAAITGLKPGKDYKVIKLGFGPATQAFQDRQIDVLVNASNPPIPAIAQIALTNKLRFLGASDADWAKPAMAKVMKAPGRTRSQYSASLYGKNAVNTEPVQTIVAWVGLGTRADVPEEVIYKMMKSFWDHIDEMHAVAPWAKDAINLKNAFVKMNMKLHPGAIRYYRERGLKIPANAMP